jgi:phage portal protein BeeE
MDETSQVAVLNESVKGGWMMPDEARQRRGLEPVPGGNTPYMQQQNYALAALAKRDAREDPFATASPPAPAPAPAEVPLETPDDEDEADDEVKAFVDSVIARLAA